MNSSTTVMRKFIKRNWPHILVWTTVLVYLIVAPGLFSEFFITKGKPLQGYEELPAVSDQIIFAFDSLEPAVISGEDIYILSGWAFSYKDKHMPPQNYEMNVVLISGSKIYFFPVYQVIQRPDIQSAFSVYEMDLTYSGFNALIAKEAIRPGEYRLAIAFRNPSGSSAHYYDIPARYIIRTPNNLYLK